VKALSSNPSTAKKKKYKLQSGKSKLHTQPVLCHVSRPRGGNRCGLPRESSLQENHLQPWLRGD
jgi:hypothetical protein